MKKNIIFSSIILILSVFSMQAQQSKYGFRMGVNLSDIDFDKDTQGIISRGDSDMRVGFTAGVFAQYFLSDKFSIQPELQFSAQGEKTKVPFSKNNKLTTDRLKINLLQIPVLAQYTFFDKLTLALGPQAGIRINEWERKEDYEAFQFSAIGGIGYMITDNISADLRASYGLTDAIKTGEESSFKATGVNHYLQFTLAYKL